MKRQVFATVAGVALLVGLAGCGTDTVDTSQSSAQGSQSGSESGARNASGASTAPVIDRTTLHWNDDFPADFPLDEIPMPAKGKFDYAELVEEDVWNVMISDIPNAEHEAWLATMDSMFKNMDEESIYYIGKGASGTAYSIRAIIFDKTDDTVTIAYRIMV